MEQAVGDGIITKQYFQFSPTCAVWVFRIEVRGDIPLRQELTINVQRLRHDAKVLNIWRNAKNIHILYESLSSFS